MDTGHPCGSALRVLLCDESAVRQAILYSGNLEIRTCKFTASCIAEIHMTAQPVTFINNRIYVHPSFNRVSSLRQSVKAVYALLVAGSQIIQSSSEVLRVH